MYGRSRMSNPTLLFSWSKSNWQILLVIFLSLLIRIWGCQPQPPLWDASVYIMMGKYIFSWGAVGCWEPYRPILWPLMLGLVWRLGGDPILGGRILGIFFSLGSIFLVYLIGRIVFEKRTGMVAALFLSLATVFFEWGNLSYTEIPSTFFVLLAIFLVFQKRYFLSGLFVALAVFTRYIQILVIPPLFLSILFSNHQRKERFSNLAIFLSGFLFICVPFLFVNVLMYQNLLTPFWEVVSPIKQYAGLWYQGPFFYLEYLLEDEYLVLIFGFLGIWIFVRQDRSLNKFVVLFTGILFFVFFSFLKAQVVRFLIHSLPCFFLFSAYGLVKTYDAIDVKKKFLRMAFLAIITPFFVLKCYQLKGVNYSSHMFDQAQEYISKNEGNLKGANIWISSPTMLVFSDLKAAELIYYPVFDAHRARQLAAKLETADLVIFHRGDFPCAPLADKECEIEKRKFIDGIVQQLKPEIVIRNSSGEVISGIYRRQAGRLY